jgi:adenosylmethionine-8-amino-7-oxononanoate aminotransferase
MHAVQSSGELILERGEGCHLWDDKGNRYIDSTAGLWYANVGYGRAEIADAAAAQMRKLHAYSHYGDVSSRSSAPAASSSRPPGICGLYTRSAAVTGCSLSPTR